LTILAACLSPILSIAQIDPIPRELVQVGYNAAFEGHAPLSIYAFYYRNEPGWLESKFHTTNLTSRLAIAPTYLDSELGIAHALGANTDLGIGLAGGGFGDSYNEVRQGTFLPAESFTGHGGEVSLSVYHLFNPQSRIPLYGVLRGTARYSVYDRDHKTDPAFVLPDNQGTLSFPTGLRGGGREPILFPSLAMELSAWYENHYRTDHGPYGFDGDRSLEDHSHLFWGQAL